MKQMKPHHVRATFSGQRSLGPISWAGLCMMVRMRGDMGAIEGGY